MQNRYRTILCKRNTSDYTYRLQIHLTETTIRVHLKSGEQEGRAIHYIAQVQNNIVKQIHLIKITNTFNYTNYKSAFEV